VSYIRSIELRGYEAIQSATTTELMFMTDFVGLGVDLIAAYKNYYWTNESLEISKAMLELGQLSQKHGVHFDIDKLIETLSEQVDEK
jgi:hypothetical protein